MTIKQFFEQNPWLKPSEVAKFIGMPKQQMNVYVHGVNITRSNLERIQAGINEIAKGLKIKLTLK